MKKCFVISPIGEEGSVEREHSDDVFDFIIKPAMQSVGMVAYRSDHRSDIGKISDQMFDSILNDDLCIAVLTFTNPNVYYELAIAQSAARPVIILIHKGTMLPFDIKDLRVIQYDLKPRPISDGVYSGQIIAMVKSIETSGLTELVPFAPDLEPLGGKSKIKFCVKAETYGPSDDWIQLLRNTDQSFDLCGINASWWIKPQGIRDLFLKKAQSGCVIRILIMHDQNPALQCMLNEDSNQGNVAKTVSGIAEVSAFFKALHESCDSIKIRLLRKTVPHHYLVLTDSHAIVVPYQFSNGTYRSPLFEFPLTSEYHAIYKAEFDSLWEVAEEI